MTHRRFRHHPFRPLVVVTAALAPLTLAVAFAAPSNAGPTGADDEGHTTHLDVPYVAGGSARQTLDLHVPSGGRRHPLVVYIHGGGWLGGDKSMLSSANTEPLLAAGFAVASINYTLSDSAKFPQQIYDVKAAIRFLRANARTYRLDGWIGLWGSSAGGQLAALASTTCGVRPLEGTQGNPHTSSCVQAVVDGYGPTDFLQLDNHLTVPGAMLHNPASSPESQYLGCEQGLLACGVERVQAANPIAYIYDPTHPERFEGRGPATHRLPAFLIAHGDTDPAVPTWQSQILYDALTTAGSDVTYYILHDTGHGFFESTALDPPYPATTRHRSRHGRSVTTDGPALSRQALVAFFADARSGH